MPEVRARKFRPNPLSHLHELLKWLPVSALVGMMAGSASALLLVSLALATRLRDNHPWLVLLLAPVGGLVGLVYKFLGSSVEAGNNLILEETHDPTSTIPLRMTPLILLATFLTHLFGGSAGREGTALQTGASLADQLARPFRMLPHERRILLMAGISAGFGSVFGTPLAGAVFGIEVLAIGKLSYDAIAPCFLASFIGDLVTHAWGVHHTIYRVTEVPTLSVSRLLFSVAAGAVFGVIAMGFAKFTHAVSHQARRFIGMAALRPVMGGAVVTAVVFAVGFARTSKYLGLGIPTIVAAFETKLPVYDFAAKFLFTGVTLGTGFKGGEVTPLFFVGSTLGNALSRILPLPSSLLAGMGFAAVFAGAANTPIASTLLAVELFGTEAGAYAGIACIVSYLCSGHSGIYHAQRVGRSKYFSRAADEGLSLGSIGKLQRIPEDAFLQQSNGFGSSGVTDMDDVTVLRLYFSASAIRRPETWWKRVTPEDLGNFLLQQAKEHGIEQALLHRVIGGYLKNQDLALGTDNVSPERFLQFVELAGAEQDLQSFIRHNRHHLRDVRAVFLRGKEAKIEAAVDREELEDALAMERREQLPRS